MSVRKCQKPLAMFMTNNSFTLVELMITVAVLSILVSIAVPVVGNRLTQARAEADQANVELLQGAYDMYYQDHQSHPTNLGNPTDQKLYAYDKDHELVVNGYLREIPASPFEIDPGYRRNGKVIESLAEGVYYD